MRFYALTTITSSTRINEFHFMMFHGCCCEGSPSIADSHSPDPDVVTPLLIMRSGNRIPEIFRPRTTLVVSEHIRQLLSGLPHISFRRAVFTKLVDQPYQAGDFSYYHIENMPVLNPYELLYRLPNAPHLARGIGQYYEVLIPRLKDISNKFQQLQDLHVSVQGCAIDSQVLRVSPSIVASYPMFWQGYIFLSDVALSILHPFIDRDYFQTSELNIDESVIRAV